MLLLSLFKIFSSIFHIYPLKWENAVTYSFPLSGFENHNQIKTTVYSLYGFWKEPDLMH